MPALVKVPHALSKTGLSRSAMYRLLRAGQFPAPVKIGRSIAFADAEIDAWIAAKLAERDAGAQP